MYANPVAVPETEVSHPKNKIIKSLIYVAKLQTYMKPNCLNHQMQYISIIFNPISRIC